MPSVDGAPATDSAATCGRYRLVHRLASGGMGTVYLARVAGPGGFEKLVALKRIHPHMASDRRFMSMFLDEARIAARIQHPNVGSVIDFGEANGAYFLTMPFIFGESLNRVIGTAARLREGPVWDLLPLVAARAIADACEGLHAAHELRDDTGCALEVVHRDVSPQNLMVGYDGVVRVLDFGVASARHRHYQTSTGEVKGKFAYLAPEQMDAMPVNRRADIWSLGVVLWEGITGRRLFARDTMAGTVRAVTSMPIPKLREIRPDAPEALQPIVDKALERDQEQRYSTAREMGKDLATFLARSERFVAAPDVAEWMSQLFPDGRQAKERLVEQTRTGSVSELTEEHSQETSAVLARGSVDSTEALAPGSFPGAREVEPTSIAEVHRQPERSTSRLPVLLAGIAVMAMMGVGGAAVVTWWLLSRGSEAAPVAAVSDAPSPPPMASSGETASAPSPPPAAPPEAPSSPQPPQATPAPVSAPEAEAEPTLAAAPEAEAEPAPAEEAPPRERRSTRRAEARRRSSRAAHGSGRLTVATPGGWALVFLGPRRLGEAPGVFTIPAGAQTISIQPFGRGTRVRRRVVVRADGVARISVPVSAHTTF